MMGGSEEFFFLLTIKAMRWAFFAWFVILGVFTDRKGQSVHMPYRMMSMIQEFGLLYKLVSP
jgi:hypothetical protein